MRFCPKGKGKGANLMEWEVEEEVNQQLEMNFGSPADAPAINSVEDDWKTVVKRRIFKSKEQVNHPYSIRQVHPQSMWQYPGGINLIEFASATGSIDAVQPIKEGKWSKLRIQVDSGAIDHVMPKETAPGIRIHPTQASMAGRGYAAANGTKIVNHGEKILKGVTEDGNPCSMAVQCADVTKTLGSVYRMNQGGNAVVFDGNDGCVINKKTKRITPIKQENGQFVMYVWVKGEEQGHHEKTITSNGYAALIEEENQDFQRQALF
jgi:hypothetical protein